MLIKKEDIILNCTSTDVLDAIDIWCIKPQVLNRRLAGCVYIFQKDLRDFSDPFLTTISELKCFLNASSLHELTKLVQLCFKAKGLPGKCILRKLFPKCLERYEPIVELVIISSGKFKE